MRLAWSQQSLAEIETIWRYIEERNPAAANRVRDRIVTALQRLESRPFVGRIGRIANTREFVFTDIPYVSVYEVDEALNQVTIMRVLHTSRFYPPKTEE
jgi:toxin ParE1/3/4